MATFFSFLSGDFGNMLATPGNVRGLFVGADDDVANGRCLTPRLCRWGGDAWQETRPFFIRRFTSDTPGHPAEFQTQTMFVMSYRTLQSPVEVWFFWNNFFCGNFVLQKSWDSHQLRLGIRPPARLGGAMRRSSANPLPGPLPLGR